MQENVSTHSELQQLADSSSLVHETHKSLPDPSVVSPNTSVLFLLSVPDALKQSLLASAALLVYTPQNEHFGIVPLEAMLAQVPVLAANEGGPLETVVEGETGWLRDIRKTEDWAAVMSRVITHPNPAELRKMGENGRQRVQAEFSKEKMALRLDQSLDQISNPQKRATKSAVPYWVWVALGATLFAVLMAVGATNMLMFALERDEGFQEARLKKIAALSAGVTKSVITSQTARAEL